MKRLTVSSLVTAVAITLAGSALAALLWVVSTTQGTGWLLTYGTKLIGVNFSAQKIDGRLLDHLLLTEVRMGLAEQKLEIGSLELDWKPLLLLAGTVAVRELVINDVRIQDDTPPDGKPMMLAWPRVSEIDRLLDAKIARLRMTNLSYRHLQEEPVQVTSLTGSVGWQDSILTFGDLDAVSPSGRINGAFSAGFMQPSLSADLTVALTQPVAEMDRFSLQVRPGSSSGLERIAGTLTAAGNAGARKLLELGGDVGMGQNGFNLRRLHLTRPGQKGVVTADGSISFTKPESLLSLQVKVAGLDLAPDLNVPTDLSGTLSFSGTLNSYHGDLTLVNLAEGWQSASVSATYTGTSEGMKLAPFTGRLLDGSLAGNLNMDWRDGFAMQGTISGRNMNPARIDPAWKGMANFNATGKLARAGKEPLTGSVSGALLESSLHGQTLTGELQAGFVGNNLLLNRLILHGRGFDLQASGELKQRLAMTAQISDLSRLVPGSAGTLQGEGWIRWRDSVLTGAVTGKGNRLAYAGMRIAGANLTARLDQGAGYSMHVAASTQDVDYKGYKLNAVTVEADGTLSHHTLNATLRSSGADARLTLVGGYKDGIWKGEIARLAGSDRNGPWKLTAPASCAVSAGKFSISPLALAAGTSERLELSADLALNPLSGQVQAQWADLNLARANPYLKDVQFKGSSSGKARIGFLSEKRLTLAGRATGSGTFTGQGQSTTIQRTLVTFDGGERGTSVGIDLVMPNGGRLKGNFSSSAPLRLVVPDRGELTAELSGFDLALLKPWLPVDTRLEGRISGRAKGIMLPGQHFELDGNSVLSVGTLYQESPDGELKLTFTAATASWGWRGEALSGVMSLTMAEHGEVRTNFNLPIPARFPVAVNPAGPLRASLVGQVQEKGIITAMFPGLLQESFGELGAELAVNGTWEVPKVEGNLRLAKGGAYLPTAGIHLKDVQLTARLEKDLIRVDSFRALSGSGHIDGTALITLAEWRVKSYQGAIHGENFQTVHFPELQILSSPKFSFEGTPQKLKLRGELRLPELNIVGAPSRTVVEPSSDVIMVGRVVPVAQSSALALDVQIKLLLGENVFVKVSGIDARLGGAIDLSLISLDRINSKGEIKVVKGRYRTYGVNLDIVRGRLYFAGGPINSPSLDFLALRTIGDVRAGVTVTGTLRKPVTKLYSEPAMPDVDILAYIVLGHPLGSSGQQASLVAQASAALLSSGQAAVLQDQIKHQLGLSTLEMQSGVGGTTGAMGYKPLQVTPPGAIPAAQQSGITETVLTVGKYLTPQLYISYGKSLFTGSNLFRLRYDIFKHWQIETQTGSGESGADLYYKLEFK